MVPGYHATYQQEFNVLCILKLVVFPGYFALSMWVTDTVVKGQQVARDTDTSYDAGDLSRLSSRDLWSWPGELEPWHRPLAT